MARNDFTNDRCFWATQWAQVFIFFLIEIISFTPNYKCTSWLSSPWLQLGWAAHTKRPALGSSLDVHESMTLVASSYGNGWLQVTGWYPVRKEKKVMVGKMEVVAPSTNAWYSATCSHTQSLLIAIYLLIEGNWMHNSILWCNFRSGGS